MDDRLEPVIKCIVLVSLIAASASCVITGHEDAAYWFGLDAARLILGLL